MLSQKELSARVLKKLGFKSTDQLTLNQAELISKVRPVSDDFVQNYLDNALDDAQVKECASQESRKQSLARNKSSTQDWAKFGGCSTGITAGFVGLGVALVSASAAPLSGFIAAPLLLGGGTSGFLGIVGLGGTTISTGNAVMSFVSDSRSVSSAQKLISALAEAQKQTRQGKEAIEGGSTFEAYQPEFSFDGLDLETADKNLTIAELRKDPNVQRMQHLSLTQLHQVLKDAVVEAHFAAAKESQETKHKNVKSVFLTQECSGSAKEIDIKNDIAFFDKVKTLKENDSN